MDALRRTVWLSSLSLLAAWIAGRSFCLGAAVLAPAQLAIQLGGGTAVALAWTTTLWILAADGRARRISRAWWTWLLVGALFVTLLVSAMARSLEPLLLG